MKSDKKEVMLRLTENRIRKIKYVVSLCLDQSVLHPS